MFLFIYSTHYILSLTVTRVEWQTKKLFRLLKKKKKKKSRLLKSGAIEDDQYMWSWDVTETRANFIFQTKMDKKKIHHKL